MATGWLRGRKATIGSVGTVAVFSTAMVGLAIAYQGQPTADVDLNDSGVWVTKADSGLIGRFNAAARTLDGTLLAGGSDFDVHQDADKVLVTNVGDATAQPIDVARLDLGAAVALPSQAVVATGAATAAILDRDKGRLWVIPFTAAQSFDPDEVEPVASGLKSGAVTVARDGTVFAAAPRLGRLFTVATSDLGAPGKVTDSNLGVAVDAEVAITAVGSAPVVLDRSASTLILPGGKRLRHPAGLDLDEAVLQQPSRRAGSVVLATPEALVSQPLGGGAARQQPATGRPAAPVQLDGCTFGAWSGSGHVIRDCPGTDDDVERRLDADASARLAYRVNRHSIVLNDLASGAIWMAADTFQLVHQWKNKIPQDVSGSRTDAEETTPQEDLGYVADRTKPNRPPIGKADTFGVRPGRTTILPVLANDHDPDGDVIIARTNETTLSNGVIQPILGGEALQAVVPAKATGTATFTYTVNDGRGGFDAATVTLAVHPMSENNKPEQTRVPTMTVKHGGQAATKVLQYFRDPDGDDLFLVGAASAAPDDVVRFHADGTVEFRDGGSSTGRRIIDLTVSDGTAVTEGRLAVLVSGQERLAPIAVNDHRTALVDQPITVKPLLNDLSPDGGDLRLARVSPRATTTITPNYELGTFGFVATRPGSYDVEYTVAVGPNEGRGLVRIDVVKPPGGAEAPIVVADTALLPAGGSVLVDVLGNDSDPTGGVLVVQTVQDVDGSRLGVALLGHATLRITEVQRLTATTVFTYTVSNGHGSATGEVRVVPVGSPDRLRPPKAVADEATVHIGDIVDIPVRSNDTHPDGLDIFLDDDLAEDADPALGEAFVSAGNVRFRAGDRPGTAYATYRIHDKNGQEDSAQITIHIRGNPTNEAPRPVDVFARVLAGNTVRIPIPLHGIDPDGDSVRLTGIVTAPKQGIPTIDGDAISYRASDAGRGLDVFGYAVADQRGLVATGTVRVGIAPAAGGNQAPVAQDDVLKARPGRRVAVAVMTNDADPDGDKIALVKSLLDPGRSGLRPWLEGDRVVVTTPRATGSSTVFYGIEDVHGATGHAALTIDVDPTAPLERPIARDDLIQPEEVVGKTAVTVDVLANDDDPDGMASDLAVSSDAPGVTVLRGGALSVRLRPTAQVLTYRVTDIDGLSAQAVVRVPGLRGLRPALRPDLPTLRVVQGRPLTIDLGLYVVVREGRTPRLTDEAKVTAVQGTREVASPTTIVYTSLTDYVGRAGVTFEVTDGTSPTDPKGHKATLTIPIQVQPRDNQAPRLTSATVRVAAGETATVALDRLATDPDGDPLAFHARPAKGVTSTITGAVLTIQAEADAKGRIVAIPIGVSDRKHAPVEGTVTAIVVASTRHLARAVDDVVPNAHQGDSVSVDVTANDVNPFPGTPLQVVGTPAIETGRGAQPLVRDNHVVVTPAKDFHGVLVVRYTIQDKTRDPDRRVDGRLRVTVLGRPDAPAMPVVEQVRSHTVVLSWDPPADNGTRITGYRVTDSRGGVRACAATTCTVSGLANNVEYTFVVAAGNGVGWSDVSRPSAVARPDERPDPPAAPELDFGAGSLTVSWTNASYRDRSPIECVDLEISPAPPAGGYRTCVPGTKLVWTGLENGTGYRVHLRAKNAAPTLSDFGDWSAVETPAGPPDVPRPPQVVRTALGESTQIRVAWGAPADHGGPITGYTIQAVRAGVVVDTATEPGSSRATVMAVPADTADYRFRVRAHNKATAKFGETEFSGLSAPLRAFAAPSAVTDLVASATGVSGQVKVSFTPATAAGVSSRELSYQYDAGAGWRKLTGHSIDGLANGSEYRISIRAVASVAGSVEAGPAARSARVSPYGPPNAPRVSAQNAPAGQTTTTVSWADPGSAGRPYHVEIRLDAGGWESVPNSGSRTVGSGYNEAHTLCARTVTAAATSAPACATGRTGARPAPTLRTSKGGSAVGQPDCTHASCAYLHLEIRNEPAHTTFRVQCHGNDRTPSQFSPEGGGWSSSYPGGLLRTDGEGSFSGDLSCYFGKPGRTAWVVTDRWGATTRQVW